ncbi:class I SAM-dependent methyltransferase [Hyphococcus luteus]|uniref:Uncharacterized protein n=1 Tax=Hyphococcus luteus TaxID=2058213 RepID=A0A2S7K7S2_9PROT|nr:methyltransferase domain-containing protein [Marinicaulis flavus]PQA88546.1 hypothetical protein CW354_09700 [Marinicaulis flavus]
MPDIVPEWKDRGLLAESDHDLLQFRSAMEFIEKIQFDGISTIADTGSGPGHQAFVFSQLGLDVTCIDYLKPAYDLKWMKPDDVGDAVFDAVWSHHCLEHIPDPIGALISWRKMLCENGTLFLTVPEIGLTMSSGHITSFNLPLLVYILAVAGFDTSTKCFTKSRSHLRALVRKAANYAPEEEGRITSMSKLAERDVFPPSVVNAIKKTGRFTAKDISLDWFGEKSHPNLLAEEAYSFVVSNLWRKI